MNNGESAQVRASFEQALAISRETGNRRGEGIALYNLGTLFSALSEYAQAQAYYEQSLDIFQEIDDRDGEGDSLLNLGGVLHDLGDYAQARAYYERSLGIYQETGDRSGEGIALLNLGAVSHDLGEYAQARAYYEWSLAICQEMGDRDGMGSARSELGEVSYALGEHAQAEAHFQGALALRRELGLPHYAAEDLAGLARVALAQDDVSQAQARVDEIWPYLKSDPALDGAVHPFRAILTCYRVLQAGEDARAADLLTFAHTLLQERAAKILDAALRHSFLHNVPEHREIVQAFDVEIDALPPPEPARKVALPRGKTTAAPKPVSAPLAPVAKPAREVVLPRRETTAAPKPASAPPAPVAKPPPALAEHKPKGARLAAFRRSARVLFARPLILGVLLVSVIGVSLSYLLWQGQITLSFGDSSPDHVATDLPSATPGAVAPVVVNLPGGGLAPVNLSGADLTGVMLTGVDLSGANLTTVNLTQADLSGSIQPGSS